MSNDSDKSKPIAVLFVLFIFIAIIWLLAQIIKNNNVNYYRCWNCNGLITPPTGPCPYCGVGIDWSAVDLGKEKFSGNKV